MIAFFKSDYSIAILTQTIAIHKYVNQIDKQVELLKIIKEKLLKN